jgi:membrane protease YdiL (CAAX protease family)
MNRLLQACAAMRRSLFPAGAAMPSPALVFFTAGIVVLAQLPENLLLRSGYISASILVNELFAVAGIPLLIIWLQKFDRRRLLPFGRAPAHLAALILLFMMGAVIAMDFATAASELVFPLPDSVKDLFQNLMAVSSNGEVAWKLIVLCIVPAVCEEIFFCGYCQSALASHWGGTKALIATAAIFALLHGNPYYVHLYFLLGLIFGWVFIVARTLWAPILCHVLNNAWTFLSHVRGCELPIHGAPPLINASIGIAGLLLTVFAAALLRAWAKHDAGDSRPR